MQQYIFNCEIQYFQELTAYFYAPLKGILKPSLYDISDSSNKKIL